MPVFRFPKPQSLFHLVSLRTAAEFITLTLLINKVTGFYGILALFTGYHLNPLQLSHYIYSLVILFVGVWLAPSIRNPRDPLRNLGLAWLYILDTVINTAYTVLFGMGWFVLLAQHHLDDVPAVPGAGKSTMEATAGFTDPKVPGAASVDVIASPAKGALTGQDAIAIPNTRTGAVGANEATSFNGLLLQNDNLTSILLLVLFALIRVYFCIVMMSYARSILRNYIATTSTSSADSATGYSNHGDASMAENPFNAGSADASRLGRIMTTFPTRRYWLGRDDYPATNQSEWERVTTGRFGAAAKKGLKVKIPSSQQEPGVGERERRARSGTGPPPPALAPGTPK